MTRLGFRGRLFLVSVALVLAFGLVSGVILESRLHALLSQQRLERLSQEARLGAELVELAPSAQDHASADRLATVLAEATGARATIIGLDGRVLGDSRVETERLSQVENHGNRPEVYSVLREGAAVGTDTRVSATLGEAATYVAVAYEHPGGQRGVVRLSVPATEIRAEVLRLRTLMGLAGLVGLFVAAFMSLLAAQLVTRELRELVAEAQRLVQDEALADEPLAERDIFQGLSGSVNRLGSALQRTMSNLARERDRFEGVLNSMQNGVLALSRRGRIKVWNAAAVELFELPDESLRNQYLKDLVDAPELMELIREAREGKEGAVEFSYSPAGDDEETVAASRRQLYAVVTPLRELPGRSGRGCVVVLRDVTDLRRLETMRRDFIANVSHELRTPVSVVRAAAEALDDGALEDAEAAPVFIGSILRNAERQAALIDDLLSLSRIEAGRMELELTPQDVQRAAWRVVEAVGVKAAEHGHTLEVSVPAGVQVMADAGSLDQILTNYLANAVAYCPDGSRIELACERRSRKTVRLEVRDDGPGVAPKHRSRLFERFYRIDKGRSRDTGGTGLGLAIVKHLAEAMHGRAGFRPNQPKGSVFWLDLPAAGPGAELVSEDLVTEEATPASGSVPPQ